MPRGRRRQRRWNAEQVETRLRELTAKGKEYMIEVAHLAGLKHPNAVHDPRYDMEQLHLDALVMLLFPLIEPTFTVGQNYNRTIPKLLGPDPVVAVDAQRYLEGRVRAGKIKRSVVPLLMRAWSACHSGNRYWVEEAERIRLYRDVVIHLRPVNLAQLQLPLTVPAATARRAPAPSENPPQTTGPTLTQLRDTEDAELREKYGSRAVGYRKSLLLKSFKSLKAALKSIENSNSLGELGKKVFSSIARQVYREDEVAQASPATPRTRTSEEVAEDYLPKYEEAIQSSTIMVALATARAMELDTLLAKNPDFRMDVLKGLGVRRSSILMEFADLPHDVQTHLLFKLMHRSD